MHFFFETGNESVFENYLQGKQPSLQSEGSNRDDPLYPFAL